MKEVKVLGYGRVSTDKQELSPEVQERQVKSWYDFQLNCNAWPNGSKWMGFLCDESVSGSVPLLERPKGQMIPVLLDPGDIFVVAKHDRAFRSGADTEETLEKLTLAGIRMVMLNLNIDTSTHDGVMMATIFGAASRWERENIRKRTKETLQYKKSMGLPHTHAPIGWKIYTCPKTKAKKYVPDIELRKIGDWCARELLNGRSTHWVVVQSASYAMAGHRRLPSTASRVSNLACYWLLDWPPKHFETLREEHGHDFGTIAWFDANIKRLKGLERGVG
jgi:DNA invertase Pin-like site-specific DNA recombinase